MVNLPLRSFPQNPIGTVASGKTAPRYMSKRPVLTIKIPGPGDPLAPFTTEISCFSPDSPDSPDPPDSPEAEVLIESTSDDESDNEEAAQEWIASPSSDSRRKSCMVVPSEKQPQQQKAESWRTRSTTCDF